METFQIDHQLSPIAVILINIVFWGGIISLLAWLIRTRFGIKSLADCKIRRNNMPFYFPFTPLLIWFGIIWVMISASRILWPQLADWQKALVDNLSLCAGGIIGAGIIIYLARDSFARRLRGFGLDIKTVGRDFLWGWVNLISAWPLVSLALIVTVLVGEILFGPGFKIEQHAELELITAYPQISLRVLIFLTAVLVAPIFEEMLFRGMFQSMLRSYLKGPWPAIAISSGLFATVHGNLSHWPALFVLGGCMGYSYERSGSLLRPIFIHSIFNGTSIIGTIIFYSSENVAMFG